MSIQLHKPLAVCGVEKGSSYTDVLFMLTIMRATTMCKSRCCQHQTIKCIKMTFPVGRKTHCSHYYCVCYFCSVEHNFSSSWACFNCCPKHNFKRTQNVLEMALWQITFLAMLNMQNVVQNKKPDGLFYHQGYIIVYILTWMTVIITMNELDQCSFRYYVNNEWTRSMFI